MQKTRMQQLPLAEATTDQPKTKELAKINEILDDDNIIIYDKVLQDLPSVVPITPALNGMTAEQVHRAAIIKQMKGYNYRALTFHPADSRWSFLDYHYQY